MGPFERRGTIRIIVLVGCPQFASRSSTTSSLYPSRSGRRCSLQEQDPPPPRCSGGPRWVQGVARRQTPLSTSPSLLSAAVRARDERRR
jgi:hypothetical protein